MYVKTNLTKLTEFFFILPDNLAVSASHCQIYRSHSRRSHLSWNGYHSIKLLTVRYAILSLSKETNHSQMFHFQPLTFHPPPAWTSWAQQILSDISFTPFNHGMDISHLTQPFTIKRFLFHFRRSLRSLNGYEQSHWTVLNHILLSQYRRSLQSWNNMNNLIQPVTATYFFINLLDPIYVLYLWTRKSGLAPAGSC